MSYSDPPPPPPPSGPYGGQPPYGAGGQPPYGAGGQPQSTSTMSVISLVLGIIGVFPCCGCFVFSIAAIVLGRMGAKEIAASGGAKKGEGLAKWGLVLGVVGLALGVLYWVLILTDVIPAELSYSTSVD